MKSFNNIFKNHFGRLVAALVGLFSIGTAHAQILQNGSFEEVQTAPNTVSFISPISVSGYPATSNPPGWGGQPDGVFNGVASFPSSSVPTAEDGTQFLMIGVGDSSHPTNNDGFWNVWQSFMITTAGVYSLTWWDNSLESGGITTAPYAVSILNQSSQSVLSGSFDAYHSLVWQSNTLLTTLEPGTYTLVFNPQNNYGNLDILLDNVSLVQATPEPSTWAMLLGGLGVLAFWRLRTRRAEGKS